MDPRADATTSGLTVACLCADWCGTCRDYRADFERTVGAVPGACVQAVWIDIEDDAELVGAVDVENFPTLLIARGREVLFFGTVTPHLSTLARLVQAAVDGSTHLGGEPPSLAVRELAARLHQPSGC